MDLELAGGTARLSPAVTAATGFLWAGLILGVYTGVMTLGFAPPVRTVRWSHIHLVTIGGFVVLILGTLPTYLAWKLRRPSPSYRTVAAVSVLLTVGFLTSWAGRAGRVLLLYDLGLVTIWATVVGILILNIRILWSADRITRDVSVWLGIVASVSLAIGTSLAVGLYGHYLSIPGGWTGLREAHIHANVLGFVGLTIVAVLLDALPRITGNSPRPGTRRVVAFFLVLGIGPLIIGPLIGRARTLTTLGMLSYGVGYLVYVRFLLREIQSRPGSGPALWLLLAHGWLIVPVLLAPVRIYNLVDVQVPAIEGAVLHGVFLGWILPVVLLSLLVINRESIQQLSSRSSRRWNSVGPVNHRFAIAWHAAVLGIGVGLVLTGIIGRVSLLCGVIILIVQWGQILHRIGWGPGRWARRKLVVFE